MLVGAMAGGSAVTLNRDGYDLLHLHVGTQAIIEAIDVSC